MDVRNDKTITARDVKFYKERGFQNVNGNLQMCPLPLKLQTVLYLDSDVVEKRGSLWSRKEGVEERRGESLRLPKVME